MGNMARDGGHLILSVEEKEKIIHQYPKSESLFKKFYGAQEFLQGNERWCLRITDDLLSVAEKVDLIKSRINAVSNFRISSDAKTTQGYSSIPHKFAQRSYRNGSVIIVPRVSSERRQYIPFGYLDGSCIISDSAQAIYEADPYVFGIISSQMHMMWVRAVGGRLESRIRYSAEICYNTFPVPELTKNQKKNIAYHVYNVLDEREKHSEKKLAELYDPEIMPEGLREAHHNLDLAVERCYRSKPFTTDEERLAYLFRSYEEMVANEKGITPCLI